MGTESLARVREQWGGLLSLLEKHSTHFRVDRIPKNDKVTLICTDDDDAAIFGDSSRLGGLSLRGLGAAGAPKASFAGMLNGENGSSAQGWSSQNASAAAGASAAGATRCLHVGNVPANMSEVQLMREFEKFGQLDGLKLVSQRNGTRRFAFITFHSIEQAITAYKAAIAADSMSDPAKSAERLQAWSDIYMKVMEDAPWAPVYNDQRFTMKSDRMGGADALYVDPIATVNFDYVYVK